MSFFIKKKREIEREDYGCATQIVFDLEDENGVLHHWPKCSILGAGILVDEEDYKAMRGEIIDNLKLKMKAFGVL